MDLSGTALIERGDAEAIASLDLTKGVVGVDGGSLFVSGAMSINSTSVLEIDDPPSARSIPATTIPPR